MNEIFKQILKNQIEIMYQLILKQEAAYLKEDIRKEMEKSIDLLDNLTEIIKVAKAKGKYLWRKENASI